MVFFEQHGVEEKESMCFFPLKNHQFPLHFHRAYEFIIVHDGEILLTIDQKKYSLQKGELAFIFGNQTHEFISPSHSDITIVLFSPELIGDFFSQYKGYVPENNIVRLDFSPEFQKLHTIYSQKSFFYKVCDLLVQQTTFLPIEQSTKNKALHKILLFVDQHYMHNCTLKTVAQQLQYDYAYLSKLFLQMTNMTFTEYLNHYRISQACYQLKNSQQTISDIAMTCGYNNLRSFNRNFRKAMHCSPTKYRDNAKVSVIKKEEI